MKAVGPGKINSPVYAQILTYANAFDTGVPNKSTRKGARRLIVFADHGRGLLLAN